MPPALAEILTTGAEPRTLEEFAQGLFRQKLTLSLKACAPLAGDPSLPGRLRGAFGCELAESASRDALEGRPCPWSPPCAFDILFRSQGRFNAHTELPKPWLISVDPVGADLEISLTLFGLASEWMPAAGELFTRALRNRIRWDRLTQGTDISTQSAAAPGSERFRAHSAAPDPGTIECRRLETLEGVGRDLAAVPDIAVLLDFVSPAAVTGHDLVRSPAALFREAGNRLEGIARWHGCSLREAVDWRFLKRLDETLDITWQDPLPLAWTRRSRRQDREIRMSGVAGQMLIQDLSPAGSSALAELWPVLVLGEAVHLGADTAFGCGRYTLVAA